MTDYLIIPDQHAHPDHDNKRADYLSQLIIDLKPDVVVNMGDAADMASLSSYDKGKRSFHGKSYAKDLEAHLDFQGRVWDRVFSRKKKTPYRVVLEGNHEHRIERALDLSPELEGTFGFSDFGFSDYYHDVVRYDGGNPGVIELDGILFSHFFPSGVMGRPVGGERPGYSLLSKNDQSSVQSHIHVFDYYSKATVSGKKLHGLVAGCYLDYIPDWAGVLGRFQRGGVAVLRDVNKGDFDFEWISIERLARAYG